MHESEKITEARYFYSQTLSCKGDPMAFAYNLSAFLTAARSVLQFAMEEAVPSNPSVRRKGPACGNEWVETRPGRPGKVGGQVWYESQVAATSTVKFFKTRRDVNIHVQPLQLRKDAQIDIREGLQMVAGSGYVKAVVGNSVPLSEPESQLPAPTRCEEIATSKPDQVGDATVTVTDTYKFLEWSGPEDIEALCLKYLSELESIVNDGHAKGFLT